MEQSDLSELRTEGTIRDEKVMYELLSAGSACGNTSSIKIDGTEYSKNSGGLNIVDSVCFDTYEQGCPAVR